MYYLILNDLNPELKELFPQGVPAYGPAPDEFVEIYDSYTWELIDIQPAFRVNLKGLTKDEELQLFNHYASILNDPHFIKSSFRLLEKNLEPIPADCVELVAWREGKKVFCFECDKTPAVLG